MKKYQSMFEAIPSGRLAQNQIDLDASQHSKYAPINTYEDEDELKIFTADDYENAKETEVDEFQEHLDDVNTWLKHDTNFHTFVTEYNKNGFVFTDSAYKAFKRIHEFVMAYNEQFTEGFAGKGLPDAIHFHDQTKTVDLFYD